MMSFSLWHFILMFALLALIAWPGVRILHKAGYSGWWVLLTFVPLVNIVFVWVFAYANWPRQPPTATSSPA